MRQQRGGRALQRSPACSPSRSVISQHRLQHRLADAWRSATARFGSIDGPVRQQSISAMVIAGIAARPAIMPKGTMLIVIIVVVLGLCAIWDRRTVLGLVLIVLALAVAGTVAMTRAVEQVTDGHGTVSAMVVQHSSSEVSPGRR